MRSLLWSCHRKERTHHCQTNKTKERSIDRQINNNSQNERHDNLHTSPNQTYLKANNGNEKTSLTSLTSHWTYIQHETWTTPTAPINPAATSHPRLFPEQSQSNERNHRPSPPFSRRRRRRLSLAANLSSWRRILSLGRRWEWLHSHRWSKLSPCQWKEEGVCRMPIAIQGANWSVRELPLDRISRDWIDWRSISNRQNGYGGGNATNIARAGRTTKQLVSKTARRCRTTTEGTTKNIQTDVVSSPTLTR